MKYFDNQLQEFKYLQFGLKKIKQKIIETLFKNFKLILLIEAQCFGLPN